MNTKKFALMSFTKNLIINAKLNYPHIHHQTNILFVHIFNFVSVNKTKLNWCFPIIQMDKQKQEQKIVFLANIPRFPLNYGNKKEKEFKKTQGSAIIIIVAINVNNLCIQNPFLI